MNLSYDAMKPVFKKLLLIFGLIAIFASVIQQDFDNYSADLTSGQSTVVQLDKDSPRDHGDTVAVTSVFYDQRPQTNTFYHSYSVSYQEPTLLVHLRPPNA